MPKDPFRYDATSVQLARLRRDQAIEKDKSDLKWLRAHIVMIEKLDPEVAAFLKQATCNLEGPKPEDAAEDRILADRIRNLRTVYENLIRAAPEIAAEPEVTMTAEQESAWRKVYEEMIEADPEIAPDPEFKGKAAIESEVTIPAAHESARGRMRDTVRRVAPAIVLAGLVVVLLFGAYQWLDEKAPPSSEQPSKLLSGVHSNDRLKRAEDPDYLITGDDQWRRIDGMWVPESKNPSKELIFAEQVTISCHNSTKTCQELKVTLAPMGGIVFVEGIDEAIWQISSWDSRGLLASYGPDIHAMRASEKCYSHVLAMTFASGAVSTSDIPTHEKGCEVFRETNSYRLVRGEYYFDATPGNDGDKPIKPSK